MILRGAPGRGSSVRPCMPSTRYRSRHLPTVAPVTPSLRATADDSLGLALFPQPRRSLFLRLHAHQNSGQAVEVLELRPLGVGDCNLCSRSHPASSFSCSIPYLVGGKQSCAEPVRTPRLTSLFLQSMITSPVSIS